MNKQKIKIDVVSDVNCPWCYLGKVRLEKAMDEAGENYNFDISFKPFELNPHAPGEGEDREKYFIRNYGKDALNRIEESSRRLEEMGREEGIKFNFDKARVIHNTFNAHRLIWLAEKYNVQEQVADALFKAHFTEGKNINDVSVLQNIGANNGIPSERLQNFFISDEGQKEVAALEQWARNSGITGVPTFIFNDKYSVSGAQPAEILKNIFNQISHKPEGSYAEGDSCSTDRKC